MLKKPCKELQAKCLCNRYTCGEDAALDLSNPKDKAYRLSSMDFDGGTIAWYRK